MEFQIYARNFRFSGGQGVSFFQGILEFPKIRHCEQSEAISRNSKIVLREFQNLFREFQIYSQEFQNLFREFQIYFQEFQNFARFSGASPTAFYKGYALNPQGLLPLPPPPKNPLKSRILLFYLRFCGNSRFILRNSKFICDEILRSSRGMTQGKSEDFYRDCPVKPDNDTRLRNSRIPRNCSLAMTEFQNSQCFKAYFVQSTR